MTCAEEVSFDGLETVCGVPDHITHCPFQKETCPKMTTPTTFAFVYANSHAEQVTEFQGAGNPDRFTEIMQELIQLHVTKSHDYGNTDPLSNLRASEGFGVDPWVGCMVRLNDKVARVQSLISKGKLQHESVEDSLRDIAVYAVLALVLREEQTQQEIRSAACGITGAATGRSTTTVASKRSRALFWLTKR